MARRLVSNIGTSPVQASSVACVITIKNRGRYTFNDGSPSDAAMTGVFEAGEQISQNEAKATMVTYLEPEGAGEIIVDEA